MHRSSQSIAALASALAKAQTGLVNPEKTMTATVHDDRRGEGTERSFRYATLASGLDLVRKALGQHEIALHQGQRQRDEDAHDAGAEGHVEPAERRRQHLQRRDTIVARRSFDGMAHFDIDAPHDIAHFIAAKGSVTLDGTSLTVNEVSADRFTDAEAPYFRV